MNKTLSAVLFLSILGSMTDINASEFIQLGWRIAADRKHQYLNWTPFDVYFNAKYNVVCKDEKHMIKPGKVVKKRKGLCIAQSVHGTVYTFNRKESLPLPSSEDSQNSEANPTKTEETEGTEKIDPAKTGNSAEVDTTEAKKVEAVPYKGPLALGTHTFICEGPFYENKLLYKDGKWVADAPYDTAGKYTYKIRRQ